MPDEVEEFLRRVAQMRAQAEAQARGQQPKPPPQKKKSKAERQQAERQEAARRQQPPLTSRSSVPSIAPLSADIVEPELAERPDRVARLVDDDLRGTQQISEHTRRLGADVDAADDKMAAHLHQIFDHRLGQLRTSSTAPAALETTKSAADMTANQILRLLSSPASIRDAIVMAEVLKRPDW